MVKRVLLVLLAVCFLLILPASAWLSEYTYRQNISITGNSEATETNYPIRFNLSNDWGASINGTLYFNGTLQSDFDDIRFTDSSDNPLDYFLEPRARNPKNVTWVEVPSIAYKTSTVIYVYYGNATVTSGSNGYNTFLEFDDFDDTSQWYPFLPYSGGTGSLEVAGGLAWVNTSGNGGSFRGKTQITSTNLSVRYQLINRNGVGTSQSHVIIYDNTTAAAPWTWGQVIYSTDATSQIYNTAEVTPRVAEPFDALGNTVWEFNMGRNYTKMWKNDTLTHSSTIGAGPNFVAQQLRLWQFAATNTSYDWIAVKKFVNPGPSLYVITSATDGLPTASFTVNATVGYSPMTVQFNDTSITDITAWDWKATNTTPGNNTQFTFSTIQNPIYSFTTGNWLVSLTVTNATGMDISDSIYINSTLDMARFGPLIANFTVSFPNETNCNEVDFTDATVGAPTGWAWFFGDEDYSQSWVRQNNSIFLPYFDVYWYNGAVLPNGHIVLTSGAGNSSLQTWSWVSQDNGLTWNTSSETGPFTARYYHNVVALQGNYLVMMGGTVGGLNDTWVSPDEGKTWYEMTAAAPWSARRWASAVTTRDGFIVLMGGNLGGTTTMLNDVWRSADGGVTWTLMNASAPWTPRGAAEAVVTYSNDIILMGGTTQMVLHGPDPTEYVVTNETWKSSDYGATWTLVNASPGWQARADFDATIQPDDTILISGGGQNGTSPNILRDTWKSHDGGATWANLTTSAGYGIATGWGGWYSMPDGSIVHDPGVGDSAYNFTAVDRMQPVGSSVQNPSHTYSAPGTYLVAMQVYNDSTKSVQQAYLTVGSCPSNPDSTILTVYPHYVTFHVREGLGAVVPDVNVTVQGISTSAGNWDWIIQLLGLPLNEVPIHNTSMSQTTDSNGGSTFFMIPTGKYNVTFTKAGYTIPPMIFTASRGQQDEDVIVWATTAGSDFYRAGVDETSSVNITVTRTSVNATFAYINMSYFDSTSHTTGGTIDVWAKNATPYGAPILLASWPALSSNFTNSTTITHTAAIDGYVQSNVTHSDFGTIERSYTFGFRAVPVKFLGFGEEIALLVALGMMMITAMLAGATHARQIVFVVCIEGWFFYFIGWFDSLLHRGVSEASLLLALILITVMAVLANWEIRKKREKY